MKLVLLLAATLGVALTGPCLTQAQDYKLETATGRVLVIYNASEPAENQIVIPSSQGLIVLNTLWSPAPAQRCKDAIAQNLNRSDFACVINTIDRLDYFGGNSAYRSARIVGHQAMLDKYQGRDTAVQAEIKQLSDMWRWKEGVSRERLQADTPGTTAAVNEERWMNTCKRRADDLEAGFSLVLPTETFTDRQTLTFGDLTMDLIWFGRAGDYEGMVIAVLPAEKIAIVPNFIMHPQHLAPYPQGQFGVLDVPRWISVLEELLEGKNAVETVLCGISDVWTRERALTHLDYIRKLWNAVRSADAAGKNLAEIQDQLSLDQDFAFVKEMQPYLDHGDDWIRPQHQSHVKLFYLQNKNLASEMIKAGGVDSLSAMLAKVRKLREEGSDLYFDEAYINDIGYYLINAGQFAEAIEVLKLNVEVFPQSANVYDSLGEAFMKSGDSTNAIDCYKKSLELNPDNNNATEALQLLQKG